MTETDLVEEALVAVELLVVGKKGNTVMQQYKKTYEVVGTKEQLEQIDLMLLYMEHLGRVGHSAKFPVFVDGDGASKMKSSVYTEQKENIKEIINAICDEENNVKGFSFE